MELRQRNNGLNMTTFHHQQPKCARRAHKQANTRTLNFTSKIAQSICAVMFTKREKSGAIIFKARCSRTAICYRFDTRHALLLSQAKVFRLANSSPMVARNPASRSRDGRATSGKTSGEMSRTTAAQLPGNDRTTANAMSPDDRQADSQDNLCHAGLGCAMAVPEACETTRNSATQRLRSSRAAVRTTANAASRKRLVGFSPSAFNHDIQQL
jgi:hypothetical protein